MRRRVANWADQTVAMKAERMVVMKMKAGMMAGWMAEKTVLMTMKAGMMVGSMAVMKMKVDMMVGQRCQDSQTVGCLDLHLWMETRLESTKVDQRCWDSQMADCQGLH